MKRSFSLLLLCAALLAGPAGCAVQPPQSSSSDGAPAAVTEFARSYLKDAAAACGFTVADTELTGLTLVTGYDLLPDASVEVYRMAYRIKPEDPDKVVLAGGMQLDDSGWLLQTSSAGSPCLVVKDAAGSYTLLGTTWDGDGEVELNGGWEGKLGGMLMDLGTAQNDSTLLNAGRLALCRSLLARADAAMAPFLAAAPTEGEPYTDEAGHVWLKLSGYEKQGAQRMDDQLLSTLYLSFPKDLADSFFNRYVYRPDSILLEREGALYVRQDAAKVLGWDYTADLSTLAVDESQSGSGQLLFTASGTGHGGQLVWHFTLYRAQEGDPWLLYRYYTLATQGWDAPAEYAVLVDGEWFGLDSGAAPAALGSPSRVEDDSDNSYAPGDFWRTEYYDAGLSATRYVAAGSDRVNGVVTLRVSKAGMPTWLGVQVGDSRDAVAAAYPGAVLEDAPSSESAASVLFYDASPLTPGFFLQFTFNQDRVLTEILIQNAFD